MSVAPYPPGWPARYIHHWPFRLATVASTSSASHEPVDGSRGSKILVSIGWRGLCVMSILRKDIGHVGQPSDWVRAAVTAGFSWTHLLSSGLHRFKVFRHFHCRVDGVRAGERSGGLRPDVLAATLLVSRKDVVEEHRSQQKGHRQLE